MRVFGTGRQRGVARRLLQPVLQFLDLGQQHADDGLRFRRLPGDQFFRDLPATCPSCCGKPRPWPVRFARSFTPGRGRLLTTHHPNRSPATSYLPWIPGGGSGIPLDPVSGMETQNDEPNFVPLLHTRSFDRLAGNGRGLGAAGRGPRTTAAVGSAGPRLRESRCRREDLYTKRLRHRPRSRNRPFLCPSSRPSRSTKCRPIPSPTATWCGSAVTGPGMTIARIFCGSAVSGGPCLWEAMGAGLLATAGRAVAVGAGLLECRRCASCRGCARTSK